MSMVKCPKCGQSFDKEKVECLHFGTRYYHLSCCSETQIYQNEIHKYVMNLWGDKYTYLKINGQIMSFISSGKFTAEGIYKTLVYFFHTLFKNFRKGL